MGEGLNLLVNLENNRQALGCKGPENKNFKVTYKLRKTALNLTKQC